MQYDYQGWRLDSVVHLPLVERVPSDRVELLITEGRIPENLSDARDQGVIFEAKSGSLLGRVPGLGSFWVTAHEIRIQRDPDIEPAVWVPLILGPAFSAFAYIQSTLPLRGLALQYAPGRAFAILGASGAGKSSLACSLIEQGCRLLTESLTVVREGKTHFLVYPGLSALTLWQDALEKLGQSVEARVPWRPRLAKYLHSVPASNEPCQLTHIFFLVEKRLSPLSCERLSGMQSYQKLYDQGAQTIFVKGLGQGVVCFQMMQALCKRAALYVLMRPDEWGCQSGLTHLIEEVLKKQEVLHVC